MQICFSTGSHLLYFKQLLFAGKYVEMKIKNGSKKENLKKKLREETLKNFPHMISSV